MEKEINYKLDKLIEVLENNPRLKRIDKLKSCLYTDNELLKKIDKLRKLDLYSNEYKKLKKELFSNKNFIEFKQLENEINILIFEINNRLKELTSERSCKNEDN